MKAVLLALLVVVCLVGDVSAFRPTRQFRFLNQCNQTVWVGSQGNPLPEQGGWRMDPGQKYEFSVPTSLSAARFWGRTGCIYNDQQHLVCETGDCPLPPPYYNGNDGTQCKGIGGIPPTTLAELTLGSSVGPDYYDLSLVDGFNLPLQITAINGHASVNDPPHCGTTTCASFDYSKCPPELRLVGRSGGVIACMSICTAIYNPQQRAQYPLLQKIWTGTDPNTGYPMKDMVCCACGDNRGGCTDPRSEFCCSPYNHDPNEKGGKCYVERWPLASTGQRYDQVFKAQCSNAYSWQFDDSSSTYQCIDPDYQFTFCP